MKYSNTETNENFDQDKWDIEGCIKKAFKKPQIQRVENFDDTTFGWLVGIEPGEMLKINVNQNQENYVRITRYYTNWNYSGDSQLRPVQIWHGELPLDATPGAEEPVDHAFLITLLKNYKKIG